MQWVWLEDADLEFMPLYADGIGGLKRESQWGQRPAVIVRGNKPGLKYGIDTVYLLKFRNVVFAGGAVQYQQVGVSTHLPPLVYVHSSLTCGGFPWQ